MPIFANPYPKAHEEESPIRRKTQKYGGKPNEKQRPKAHQEDQRARKVQRKKCKRKRSAAECKSAAKYRSTIEYSSLAKWLRQIKANWAQNPFDPVNIIWPTKAQILLCKIICVKTNMKKHNEKKQEIAGSINSRNCVKERKFKPEEMTNTTGNA